MSQVIPAGRLHIRVQPEDADIAVDGFQLSPANGLYEIGLLVGPHKLEVKKTNYENYSAVVEVHRNESMLLTISLKKMK